jgi:hypothetical protein
MTIPANATILTTDNLESFDPYHRDTDGWDDVFIKAIGIVFPTNIDTSKAFIKQMRYGFPECRVYSAESFEQDNSYGVEYKDAKELILNYLGLGCAVYVLPDSRALLAWLNE